MAIENNNNKVNIAETIDTKFEMEDYFTERIVDKREINGSIQYLIERTSFEWKPIDSIDCPYLIYEFEEQCANENDTDQQIQDTDDDTVVSEAIELYLETEKASDVSEQGRSESNQELQTAKTKRLLDLMKELCFLTESVDKPDAVILFYRSRLPIN